MIANYCYVLICALGPVFTGAGGERIEDRARFVLSSVGAELGIGAYHPAPGQGAGVAAADYDDDGDIDLFVAQGFGHRDALWRNDGGVFTDVAAASGLTTTFNARCGLWCDFDADGLLDLVVMHDQFQRPGTIGTRTLALYQQRPDRTFEEVTGGSGLDGFGLLFLQAHGGGMCAGDLTGDGLPELVVTAWDRGARVYRNDGAMVFTDITGNTDLAGDAGSYWQPVMFDADDDGDLDVLIAHDFFENALLINDGAGGLVDAADAYGIDSAFNEMGIALGDPDMDGDWDVSMTNLYTSPMGVQEHNVYFEREGPVFVERAVELGVGRAGYAWGTVFTDLDNDGRVDLLCVNEDEANEDERAPWRAWRNVGSRGVGAVFRSVEDEIGFGFDDHGSALIDVDLDRDGDQDLVVTVLGSAGGSELRVLENDAAQNIDEHGWIVVRPRMWGTSNTRALGSVVRVRVGDVWQSRIIGAGVSFQSQRPAEAHFGLGVAGVVDELVIEWAGGGETVLFDVGAGSVVDVTPGMGRGGAIDGIRTVIPWAMRGRGF